MRRGWPVAVVMPARDEVALIAGAVASVPEWVDLLVVVDDGSHDGTEVRAEAAMRAAGREAAGAAPRPIAPAGVVIDGGGRGVGAALSAGYQRVLGQAPPGEREWLVAVMAGDGQMDPLDLPGLLDPLIDGHADHVKGDRWAHEAGPDGMPRHRRLGSHVLGWLTRRAAGLPVRDPQCGYTATHGRVLRAWPWERSWTGYGYPNWWLLEAGRRSLRVVEVPCRSVYGAERSGLRVRGFLPPVAWMLFAGLWCRGIDWYVRCDVPVRSRGRAHLLRRLAVAAGWTGALATLVSGLAALLTSGVGGGGPAALRGLLLVVAAAGLFWLVASLDKREAQWRRHLVAAGDDGR